MLTSIQATEYHREVTLVLQMLMCSNQRLTLEACNDAVLVRPEEKSGFSARDQFFNSRDIVNLCSGLVTTVWSDAAFMESEHLQLAHASVREYLSSQEVIQPFQTQLKEKHAKACLLRLCHAYLCYIDWTVVGEKPDELDRIFPLADWAASTWPEHARYLEAIDDHVLASVINFLQQACVLSQDLFRYNIAQFYWADRTQCYPLYMAALMGLQRTSRQLILSDRANTSRGSVQKYLQSKGSSLDPAAIQTRLDASLLAASARGYITIVRDLLAQGARPDVFRFRHYSDEYTALHLASKLGHTEILRLLIEGGASVDYNVKPSHKTALYEASGSGHVDVVKVLLTHEADPDIHSDGRSPLRAAVSQGHTAVAQALISAGANRNIHSIYHLNGLPPFRRGAIEYHWDSDLKTIDTLLKLAVSQNNESMVQLLLDNDFSMYDADGNNQTVLHLATEYCGTTIMRILLDHGALVDSSGPTGTALLVAARSGRCDAVQTLLDYRPDLDGCKWHGPSLAAADKGHFDIIERILLHGVHINESSLVGTALFLASESDSRIFVRMLLQHGAHVDEHEEGKRTPLQIATAKRHLGIMRLLIRGGADVDLDGWPKNIPYQDQGFLFSTATTEESWLHWLHNYKGPELQGAGDRRPWEPAELLSIALAPLQIAVIQGSPEVVQLLIDSGADVNKGQRYTPLQIAVDMGYIDIVEMLLDNGAYLDISDPDGILLELATRHNHKTILELLIAHGTTVEGSDAIGPESLQLAALYGHVRAARVLLAARYKPTTETSGVNSMIRSWLGSALNIAVCAETFGYDNLGGYDHLGIVRLLFNPGFLSKSEWVPALHQVIRQGYVRYLHLFLERGIDVNESYIYCWETSIADVPRGSSWNALQVAAFHGHREIVRLLLHCGADINDTGQDNCALASAAAGRQESMMRLLVKRGANIDLAIQVTWGWTNSRKITRRLSRLHTSFMSPLDHPPEWQGLESLFLLDEGLPRPPGDQAALESRQIPLIVVEDHDKVSPQSLIGGASSRRRSRISSTVSRLRDRLSRN
jgi:ankyrin repeat protein